MDARDIEKLVMKAKDDIIKEVHDKLPRKVGVVDVNHFKQNFRVGGSRQKDGASRTVYGFRKKLLQRV